MTRLARYGYLFLYTLGSMLGRKRPLLGGVKLTHTCNLKCTHCPFWKRGNDTLSFDQAVSAMSSLYQAGVRILILEGGEPLLWEDSGHVVEDIVREAKKRFFSVGITTNGTRPIETEADIVWVSIDGLKNTHNQLRDNSFEVAIDHIESSSHPRIFAHVTINSVNHEEISRLIEFLSDKVQGITIQFHYPYEGVDPGLVLPWHERRVVLDALMDLKKRGFPVSDSFACLKALKDNRWTCRPWMVASVDPDGRVTHGCYVMNRGPISCEQCGFAAHTEISLAYRGVPGAIWAGIKIFGI